MSLNIHIITPPPRKQKQNKQKPRKPKVYVLVFCRSINRVYFTVTYFTGKGLNFFRDYLLLTFTRMNIFSYVGPKAKGCIVNNLGQNPHDPLLDLDNEFLP